MNKVKVKLENVTKTFDKKAIVKDLSLDIYEGEFLTFLGPSGCGKTTILRIISGLEFATSGKVFLENEDVTLKDATKREVNTIFQNFALFPHKTVYDNVAFGLVMKHIDKTEIKKRVNEVLKIVNLEGYEMRYPRELSGGQQQRVAIARGIITKPKVLLLDESLCSLDLKLKRKMQIELKKIQKKLGLTFIYVTHDQNEAITMSDRIAIINNGVIEQIGTPQEIYTKPNSIFTADFIGESNIVDAKVESISEENILVKLENNISLTLETDNNYKKDDSVKIMIRPEHIKVSKDYVKESYEGIIDDIIFMGDYSKLYVLINDFIFKIDENDINLYKVGEKVYVKFDRKYIVDIKDKENEKR